MRKSEGEALKPRHAPRLRCTGVRKLPCGRDGHALVDPIFFHAPENIQILLRKFDLHLEESREFSQLIDLVFLDSVHPSSDIFGRFLTGVRFKIRFRGRTRYLLFALADVELDVSFFLVLVFFGAL